MPDFSLQPEDPPDQKSLNRKFILIGIITVAFVILIILLFFQLFLQTKSSDVPSVKINKASPSATQATPSAQKDETSDWKVYSSEELAVSINYPTDWRIVREEIKKTTQDFSEVVFAENNSTGNPAVTIRKTDPSKFNYETIQSSYEDILKKEINKPVSTDAQGVPNALTYTRLSNVIVSGILGLKQKQEPKNEGDYSFALVVIMVKNETYYQIILDADTKGKFESSINIFEQILSTFRFD